MGELFRSRGRFILGHFQGPTQFQRGEISLDEDTISFKYDKTQAYNRLKIIEIDQIVFLPSNKYLEISDVLGLRYGYYPTIQVGDETAVDMEKLEILANLTMQVKAQSTPIIIESEFQKKQIQQDRIQRVIREREIREKQQFKKEMELILTKLKNEKVRKLAKILSGSNRIKLDLIMEILKISSSTFYNDILPIAIDHGFTIDGDVMDFQKTSIPEFIYKLTNYFFLNQNKLSGEKLTIKGAKVKHKTKPKKPEKEAMESPAPTEEDLEEERIAQEETEEEVSVKREKFLCIVHKGPIEGDNYLCPSCFTFYCVKCAKTLKKQGENCWTCGTEFKLESTPVVPSEVMEKVQKLEKKMSALKRTAANLDESFYTGAIEREEYQKMKDSLVEKILKLNTEIAEMKEKKTNETDDKSSNESDDETDNKIDNDVVKKNDVEIDDYFRNQLNNSVKDETDKEIDRENS